MAAELANLASLGKAMLIRDERDEIYSANQVLCPEGNK